MALLDVGDGLFLAAAETLASSAPLRETIDQSLSETDSCRQQIRRVVALVAGVVNVDYDRGGLSGLFRRG